MASTSRRGWLQERCRGIAASKPRLAYLREGKATGVSEWSSWPDGTHKRAIVKVFRVDISESHGCSHQDASGSTQLPAGRQQLQGLSTGSRTSRPTRASGSAPNTPLAANVGLTLPQRPVTVSSGSCCKASASTRMPGNAPESTVEAKGAVPRRVSLGDTSALEHRPTAGSSSRSSPPSALGEVTKEMEEEDEALAELAALQSDGLPVVWPQ